MIMHPKTQKRNTAQRLGSAAEMQGWMGRRQMAQGWGMEDRAAKKLGWLLYCRGSLN